MQSLNYQGAVWLNCGCCMCHPGLVDSRGSQPHRAQCYRIGRHHRFTFIKVTVPSMRACKHP